MASIQYYDVIIRPVITEKSMADMGEKKYTFLVHPEANKTPVSYTHLDVYKRQTQWRMQPLSWRIR